MDRDASPCRLGELRTAAYSEEFWSQACLSASGPGGGVRWRVLENQVAWQVGGEREPTQEGGRRPSRRSPGRTRQGPHVRTAGLWADGWSPGPTAGPLGGLCRSRPPLRSALLSPSQHRLHEPPCDFLFKDSCIGRVHFLQKGFMRSRLSDFLQAVRYNIPELSFWCRHSHLECSHTTTQEKIHNRLAGD